MSFDSTKDGDGDGLSDFVERTGWRTSRDGVFVTDPRTSDSDADGLTDGQEAGPVADRNAFGTIFVGLSKPVAFDTDGDEIGDGDEYFLDMDPRLPDTDEDGLLDGVELGFGSDPTHGNADGDTYSDKDEFGRGSNPLAYDLDRGEAAAAFVAGATFGDSQGGARRFARMNDPQLQSPEYLAGQVASGFIGVGDVRDVASKVGRGDLVAAAVSAVGLAPLAGDAAKTAGTLTNFAKRGDSAARATDYVIERLPWSSKAFKEKVRRQVFGTAARLPSSLQGGPKDYVVYRGVGYVGITKDFARRAYEHERAGRAFAPELITAATGLSRGEARAIEEHCIVQVGLSVDGGTLQNQLHSIDPTSPHHADAITWAKAFMDARGGTCA